MIIKHIWFCLIAIKHFVFGLTSGAFLIAVPVYFIFHNLVYCSIYSKDFSESKFYNDVHCGLSKSELRSILGEPLDIKASEGKEAWLYSKRRFVTEGYVVFSVEFNNGMVYDKRTEFLKQQ